MKIQEDQWKITGSTFEIKAQHVDKRLGQIRVVQEPGKDNNPEGRSNVKDACAAAALSLQGPGEGTCGEAGLENTA